MTLEELKVEAKKLGYRLVKEPEKVALLPCKCGRKNPSLWLACSDESGWYYKCDRCWLKSDVAKTKIEARKAWNKAVQDEVEP